MAPPGTGHSLERLLQRPATSPARSRRLETEMMKMDLRSWMRRHGLSVPAPPLAAAAKAEIEDCFRLMDSDGSGAIDVDEITTAFNTCGIAFQKSDMKAILKDLDNEGTGAIDMRIFTSLMSRALALDKNGKGEGGIRDQVQVGFTEAVRAYRRKKLIEGVEGGTESRQRIVSAHERTHALMQEEMQRLRERVHAHEAFQQQMQQRAALAARDQQGALRSTSFRKNKVRERLHAIAAATTGSPDTFSAPPSPTHTPLPPPPMPHTTPFTNQLPTVHSVVSFADSQHGHDESNTDIQNDNDVPHAFEPDSSDQDNLKHSAGLETDNMHSVGPSERLTCQQSHGLTAQVQVLRSLAFSQGSVGDADRAAMGTCMAPSGNGVHAGARPLHGRAESTKQLGTEADTASVVGQSACDSATAHHATHTFAAAAASHATTALSQPSSARAVPDPRVPTTLTHHGRVLENWGAVSPLDAHMDQLLASSPLAAAVRSLSTARARQASADRSTHHKSAPHAPHRPQPYSTIPSNNLTNPPCTHLNTSLSIGAHAQSGLDNRLSSQRSSVQQRFVQQGSVQQGNDSRMDGEQTGQACDVETDHETVATKVQRSVDAYFGGMRRRMLTQEEQDSIQQRRALINSPPCKPWDDPFICIYTHTATESRLASSRPASRASDAPRSPSRPASRCASPPTPSQRVRRPRSPNAPTSQPLAVNPAALSNGLLQHNSHQQTGPASPMQLQHGPQTEGFLANRHARIRSPVAANAADTYTASIHRLWNALGVDQCSLQRHKCHTPLDGKKCDVQGQRCPSSLGKGNDKRDIQEYNGGTHAIPDPRAACTHTGGTAAAERADACPWQHSSPARRATASPQRRCHSALETREMFIVRGVHSRSTTSPERPMRPTQQDARPGSGRVTGRSGWKGGLADLRQPGAQTKGQRGARDAQQLARTSELRSVLQGLRGSGGAATSLFAS